MLLFKNIEIILQNNHFLFGIFFFYFGSILGSFFNVVILRYPLMLEYEDLFSIKEWFNEKKYSLPKDIEKSEIPNLSLSFPASHCFTCKKELKWYHNIPLFSYLFLRGKCSYCKTHISLQYPIVEFISGLLLLASFLYFIDQGLIYFILGSAVILTLFVISVIDYKIFILPDTTSYVLLWASLIINAATGFSLMNISLQNALYGAVAGYLMLFTTALIAKIIAKRDAMGQGDFKLLAALGAFIGLKGVIFTYFYATFVGIAFWIILKTFSKTDNMIPYGPSLIIAAITYFLCGEDIINLLT